MKLTAILFLALALGACAQPMNRPGHAAMHRHNCEKVCTMCTTKHIVTTRDVACEKRNAVERAHNQYAGLYTCTHRICLFFALTPSSLHLNAFVAPCHPCPQLEIGAGQWLKAGMGAIMGGLAGQVVAALPLPGNATVAATCWSMVFIGTLISMLSAFLVNAPLEAMKPAFVAPLADAFDKERIAPLLKLISTSTASLTATLQGAMARMPRLSGGAPVTDDDDNTIDLTQ